jgi:hypothetical protein
MTAGRLAEKLERLANSQFSFDQFIHDVDAAFGGLHEALVSAQQVQALLERSGYGELATRMGRIVDRIEKTHTVIEQLGKLYHSGKLRYGPSRPDTSRK